MIKNIIFDVGEVLLSYRWLDVLMESGADKENALRIKDTLFDSDIWHEEFDGGYISVDELLAYYIKNHPEDEYAYRYFFSHAEDLPVKRPAVVAKLPLLKEKGYKLYILSDYSQFLSEAHFKHGDFLPYMDGIVISYQEHLLKPDPKLFNILLDRYNLSADETVFFDDKKMNVDGANAMGINGIYTPSEDILITELDKLIEM